MSIPLLVTVNGDIDTHDLSDIINSTFGNKCSVIHTLSETYIDRNTHIIIETYSGKGREKMDNLIEELKLYNTAKTFYYETEEDYIKYTIQLHI